MSPSRESVVAGLGVLLGPDRVSTDPETLARRSLDTWPLRLVQTVFGLQPAAPLCVVRPRSTDEVSRALAHLHREGVPVVPYGGGSGVLGGARASSDSVVLDLGAMDQVLGLDEDNLTASVQAGVFLGKLEAWLNERGYITGHYPQSIDVAQMGGLVATRSAGQFSTKYGNIEDLLVSLEAVLPDGRITRIKDAPRRSTGPDLRHIWLGSEGAFGVITEVTVKVFPRPADRWLQAYAVPNMRVGLEVVHRALRDGWRPAVARLHDEVEAERSYDGAVNRGESILLLLSEGPDGYAQVEGRALDRAALAAGLRPLGPGPVEAWLAHRNDVSLFEQLIRAGILVDTIEVSARWTDIAGIYEHVTERLRLRCLSSSSSPVTPPTATPRGQISTLRWVPSPRGTRRTRSACTGPSGPASWRPRWRWAAPSATTTAWASFGRPGCPPRWAPPTPSCRPSNTRWTRTAS